MIFKDVTNFTSAPIDVPGQNSDAFVTVTGAIEVAIEIKQEDGVWRSFPETTVTGPKAVSMPLPAGQVRVKVVSGPATVSVQF